MSTLKLALIIFIRNPVAGKVKTRLAKTIGAEKALIIYKYLLQHTCEISRQADCNKFLYYSNFIDEDDDWDNRIFNKRLQHPGDLGERMSAAFTALFNEGYQRLLIIGSDCLELNSGLIHYAFDVLGEKKVVIGPSSDGGYYLLGMRYPGLPLIFENKRWGTNSVLSDTIDDLLASNTSFELLKVLNDVDEETDLPYSLLEKLNREAH